LFVLWVALKILLQTLERSYKCTQLQLRICDFAKHLTQLDAVSMNASIDFITWNVGVCSNFFFYS